MLSSGERRRSKAEVLGWRHRRQYLFTGWPAYIVWPVILVVILLLRRSIVNVTQGHTPVLSASTRGAAAPAAGERPGGPSPGQTGQGRSDDRTPSSASASQAGVPDKLLDGWPKAESKRHCADTCFKANDGVCDEGRAPHAAAATAAAPSAQQQHPGRRLHARRHQRRRLRGAGAAAGVPAPLLCDLGTDCADCGEWLGSTPPSWGRHPGPVAWARARNVSMFARRTATPRPFTAAIAHHKADPDVSAMIWHYGVLETGITRVMHAILDGGACGPAPGRVVLDVGANMGYFAVQAALYGCRVVAFEPVAKFRAFLEWAAHANGVAGRLALVRQALSDAAGSLTIGLPREGTYWGLASVDGINLHAHEMAGEVNVPASTLDAWEAWGPPGLRPEEVLLLKLDVEGWEPAVLRGGARLLAAGVQHVLTEYGPGIWERRDLHDLAPQAQHPQALLGLARAGFDLAHLPLFTFAAEWPPPRIATPPPLPAFEEVTEEMLEYDLAALRYRERMEVSPGGCPMAPELRPFPAWASCAEWAYGAHPKGLRPTFGFLTNVWAARRHAPGRDAMRLNGSAALFGADQDMKTWTSLRRPGTAMGLIECDKVGWGHALLFRCACPAAAPPECGEQEQAVLRLAGEGRMPFTDGAAEAEVRAALAAAAAAGMERRDPGSGAGAGGVSGAAAGAARRSATRCAAAGAGRSWGSVMAPLARPAR